MNFKKSKNAGQNIRIVDVKKTVCLMLVIALFSTFSINAQTVPEPPKPPKTTSVSSSSSTSSYAIEVDNDNNQHNSSVSISVSDDSYKFRASYHKSKNEGVKAMLFDQLGKDNLAVNGQTYLWADRQSGKEVFECKLTSGHLKIFVDTEAASKSFMDKINTLGNKLKYYISGSDAKKEEAKTTERAKKELENAEKELARAKREMARVERETQRAGEN